MKTTDILLEATKEIWKAYNEHPFVKGICDWCCKSKEYRNSSTFF